MTSSRGSHDPLDLPETKEYTHRSHRFPGKFHPPLINKLIKDHPDHDVIADPMSGSGTVGVESAAAGKDAICVDLDPLSTLMTRAKSIPVDPDEFVEVGEQILAGVDNFPEEGEPKSEESAREAVETNLSGTPFCVPYNLFHWFEPYVAVGFSRLLLSAYDELDSVSPEMDDAIRMSLASIVRKVSRADPQPVSGLEVTKVRRQQLEEGIDFDVEMRYRQALSRIEEGYRELLEEEPLGDVTAVQDDARNLTEVCEQAGKSPSMVITSPPYCNAIEYSRRHRLEYEWLGLFNGEDVDDPRDERLETSREYIGSHTSLQDSLRGLPEVPHPEIEELMEKIEPENERKANLLREYFHDAYEWIEEVHTVLPDGGLFCLIVGPSTSYGNTVRTPKFLRDIAEETGFTVEDEQRYKLINNKMQYPTEGETTDMEALIKFRV